MKRKIKFEAYRIVAYAGDPLVKIPYDFNRFILKADGISEEGRTYPYYDEQATLADMVFDANLWYIKFSRLRDTNIPSIVKVGGESEPIELEDDEYIGENALMIYDTTFEQSGHSIISLQRNLHSLGPSGIEKYLNNLWAQEDGIVLKLEPIIEQDVRARLARRQVYKKINVRLCNVAAMIVDENSNTSIKKIINGLSGFNGLNAQVSISVGRSKQAYLSTTEVNEALEMLEQNRGVITGAEITYENEDSKTEVVDLFDNKIVCSVSVELIKRQEIPFVEIMSAGANVYREQMQNRINNVIRVEANGMEE